MFIWAKRQFAAMHMPNQRCRLRARLCACIAIMVSCAFPEPLEGGAETSPLARVDQFLQTHDAPALHALRPFYVGQTTDSSCSVATAVMLINALRQQEIWPVKPPLNEDALLRAVGDKAWADATVPGGKGVRFAEFQRYLRESLDRFGFEHATIEVFSPQDNSLETQHRLRRWLSRSAESSRDFLIAGFDQGTLTGGYHIGHFSPIGAYDSSSRQVLILDVDRDEYPPYWSGEDRLLQSMLAEDPTDPTDPNGLILVHLDGGSG